MPLAAEKATPLVTEPAADGEQPAGPGVARAAGDVASTIATPPTSAKPSSQPAWPPSAVFSRRNARRAAEDPPPPPPPPGPRPAAGPAGLAVDPAETVVAEDQPPDPVVGRARDPRPIGSGRQRDQHRPRAADDAIASAAGEHRTQATARRAARPRATPPRCPARPSAPTRHLGLEAEPDAYAGQHEPAGAPALERAHRRTTPAATQHRISSASGLLWREIATAIGVSGEHEPGDEAADAAEAPAHEVVDERRPSRRPSAPPAPGCSASGSRRPRPTGPAPRARAAACPPSSRRCIERRRRGSRASSSHRAHGRAVVLVGPAVAAQRPEIQHAGEHQQRTELGTGSRRARTSGRTSRRLRRGSGVATEFMATNVGSSTESSTGEA